jgi:hypothetical protein
MLAIALGAPSRRAALFSVHFKSNFGLSKNSDDRNIVCLASRAGDLEKNGNVPGHHIPSSPADSEAVVVSGLAKDEHIMRNVGDSCDEMLGGTLPSAAHRHPLDHSKSSLFPCAWVYARFLILYQADCGA